MTPNHILLHGGRLYISEGAAVRMIDPDSHTQLGQADLRAEVRQLEPAPGGQIAVRVPGGVHIVNIDTAQDTPHQREVSCMCSHDGKLYLAHDDIAVVDNRTTSMPFGSGERIVGINVNDRGIHVLRLDAFELYGHDQQLIKSIPISGYDVGDSRVMLDLFPGGAMAHVGDDRALLFAC